MNLYRVVISFFREQLQFTQERGCLAMTPGQALDDTFSNLGIDRTKITDLKVWVELPKSLDSFGRDAVYLRAVNSDQSVGDLWKSRAHL